MPEGGGFAGRRARGDSSGRPPAPEGRKESPRAPSPAPGPAAPPQRRLEAEANAVGARVGLGLSSASLSPRTLASQARREADVSPSPASGGDPGSVARSAGELLGYDFSGVRIHAGEDAARKASAERAHAFAAGRDVYFGRGRFRPDLPTGRALIAHELAHVAQQGAAPRVGSELDPSGIALHDELHAETVTPAPAARGLRMRAELCDPDPAPPTTAPTKSAAPANGQAVGQGLPARKVPAAPTAAERAAAAQAAAATAVGNVRSMEMETFSGTMAGLWADVRVKKAQLDTQVGTLLGLVKAGGAQEATLKAMQGRLAALQTALNDASFVPASGALTFQAATTTDLAADKADAAGLKGTKFQFLGSSVAELKTSFNRFVARRGTLAAEGTQWHRFDASFTVADAMTLLRSISPAVLTAADIKALIGKESADLTNTTIAGISGKKEGITSSHANPSFVGVAQVGTAARDDAIAWAAAHGVVIPASPDPRKSVPSSILLCIAYLGWNADRLTAQLPGTQPTGLEFKKLLFAAYNGGYKNVVGAATSAGKKAYTWNDIKDQPKVSDEMRDYVVRILARL